MPSAHGAHVKYAWKHQPLAELTQLNPVSGASYTVLAAAEDVRIICMAVSTTWTVQPTPIRIYETIDGIVYNWYFNNPASATGYYANEQAGEGIALPLSLTDEAGKRAFLHEGQSVKVEIVITGGTVQQLFGRVKWGRLLPT